MGGSPRRWSIRWWLETDSWLSKSFKILTTWSTAGLIKCKVMLRISWRSHCVVAWQAFKRLQSFMAVGFIDDWTLRTAVSCLPGKGKPYLYPCRFDRILWKKIDKKFDQFVRRVIDCCTTMGATAAKVKHVQVEKQLSRHNYSISHHTSTAARALPPAKVWLKRSTHSSKVLHSPRK